MAVSANKINLGVVLEKAAIARFARTLETMFAAGTPPLWLKQ